MKNQTTSARLLWFVVLWLAGFGTVAAVAYIIRLVLL